MIDEAWYAIDWHRPYALAGDVAVKDELRLVSDCQNTLKRGILLDELLVQLREILELLCQMPIVESLGICRAQLASNLRRMVAILRIPLLITEREIVDYVAVGVLDILALSVDLLVKDCLLSEVGELRPIEVELGLA